MSEPAQAGEREPRGGQRRSRQHQHQDQLQHPANGIGEPWGGKREEASERQRRRENNRRQKKRRSYKSIHAAESETPPLPGLNGRRVYRRAPKAAASQTRGEKNLS